MEALTAALSAIAEAGRSADDLQIDFGCIGLGDSYTVRGDGRARRIRNTANGATEASIVLDAKSVRSLADFAAMYLERPEIFGLVPTQLGAQMHFAVSVGGQNAAFVSQR